MIDEEKYEGHTPAPWTVDVHKVGEDTSAIVIESAMTTHSNDVLAEVEVENHYALIDAQLIADAPLLLEFYKEVKRIMDIDEILETSRVELIWIKLLEMSA